LEELYVESMTSSGRACHSERGSCLTSSFQVTYLLTRIGSWQIVGIKNKE
jgi:hypothetical protein